MKVYTVHEPPRKPSETEDELLDRITFVKEGFCWPALFIPMIWLLWHRMWLVLLAWAAIGAALAVAGELVDWLEFPAGVLSFLFAFWFALEANGLRRWSLTQKGWAMLGVAAGRDREEAEQSFFRRHVGDVAAPPMSPTGPSVPGSKPVRPASAVAPARPPAPARPSAPKPDQPVIGMFPQPE